MRIGEERRAGVGVGAWVGQEVEKEQARGILTKVAQALRKPGTSRSRVYLSSVGKAVYAYYLDPADPALVVREDEAGNRVSGRLVGGRFRAQPAQKG